MNNRIHKIFSNVFLVIIAQFLLASCNGDNGDSFPQLASPPPFDYEDGEELRSEMHQLAFAMLRLDDALADEDELDEIEQGDVVDSLRRIRQIGESLQVNDIRSAHPYLADDMYKFLIDVDQAILYASMRSPRYYMAGRVSGSCVACHRAND